MDAGVRVDAEERRMSARGMLKYARVGTSSDSPTPF